MPKVIVAGSINMDVVARTSRHPRAGETVPGKDLQLIPGGKGANQAVAARRLGAETVMIGKLGSDAFGDTLAGFLESEGVEISRVRRTAAAATGTALIVVDDAAENSIVVVPGTNELLMPDDIPSGGVEEGDILVSQFEIPQDTIAAFFRLGRRVHARNILNPAPAKACPSDLMDLADVLVVNETELSFFAGKSVTELATTEQALSAAHNLRTRNDQIVIVTLGSNGAVAVLSDEDIEIAGRVVDAVDTTGAGDCFVGALCAQIAAGQEMRAALEFANVAASICVQSVGAGVSMPHFDDVAGARARV